MSWWGDVAARVLQEVLASTEPEELRSLRAHGSRRQMLVVGPAAGMVVGPTPRPTIAPVQRAVWDDKGWTVTHADGRQVYQGQYAVRDRRTGRVRLFAGRVRQSSRGVEAYIADPPAEIRRHAKGPCFALVELPWFRVHWYRAAYNVDDAILYVERILDEALNR